MDGNSQNKPANDDSRMYLFQASWAGVPIIQGQWTSYAQDLFKLILLTFSSSKGKFADLESIKSKASLSDEDWVYALDYAAQVTSTLTNYKTFGSSKFIPRIAKDKFRSIVANSSQAEEALKLWDKVCTFGLYCGLPAYSSHSTTSWKNRSTL